VEVHHAAAEPPFVYQVKFQAHIVGKRLMAASDHYGRDDQVARVDQPGLNA
jgi:hypothetical protein